ncbi:MAG: hypothetical protein CMJ17_00355 [Phenylobacterium sp.]|nr:hypothetical protein [Phenylobacterium sp.]
MQHLFETFVVFVQHLMLIENLVLVIDQLFLIFYLLLQLFAHLLCLHQKHLLELLVLPFDFVS